MVVIQCNSSVSCHCTAHNSHITADAMCNVNKQSPLPRALPSHSKTHQVRTQLCVICGFHHKQLCSKNCALLGCYAASNGNSLPTFRDNLSAQFSGLEESNSCVRRTALFWVVTQRVVVISYRRFGTTYRPNSQG